MRKKDKAFSFRSTTAEALTTREIDSNHLKGKGDVGKSNTGNRDLERTSMFSIRKKDNKRLII